MKGPCEWRRPQRQERRGGEGGARAEEVGGERGAGQSLPARLSGGRRGDPALQPRGLAEGEAGTCPRSRRDSAAEDDPRSGRRALALAVNLGGGEGESLEEKAGCNQTLWSVQPEIPRLRMATRVRGPGEGRRAPSTDMQKLCKSYGLEHQQMFLLQPLTGAKTNASSYGKQEGQIRRIHNANHKTSSFLAINENYIVWMSYKLSRGKYISRRCGARKNGICCSQQPRPDIIPCPFPERGVNPVQDLSVAISCWLGLLSSEDLTELQDPLPVWLLTWLAFGRRLSAFWCKLLHGAT
ncbi:uncharacterized protein LOC114222116 [Eumetopias jubatus]|uniref:uncharacterized protein LOC114222116 n=1 Tax=Eumetopias jubatus TaxID=34886 RepID=UPI0010163946|nr:uncharacterized protein LOC114222116 [Eumetopias jubatus]